MVWVVVAIVALISARSCAFGEVEGRTTFEDCRTHIDIKSNDFGALTNRFVGSTKRTSAGAIMEATCVHVDLSAAGTCEQAEVYTKPPAIHCQQEAPWLGFDGQCHAEYANEYVLAW